MSETLLDPYELAEFRRSMLRVIAILERFGRRLTPRELYVLRLGMRAAHVEEAIAAGDSARARAHLDRLVRDVQTMQGRSEIGAAPAVLPILAALPFVPP